MKVQIFECQIQNTDLFRCQIDNSLFLLINKVYTRTTGNSNTSVGDEFFCAFFSIHREKFVIFLCVSKIPTEIFKNPQKKLRDFSVRVNTHRKIDIILSVFSKLTEKRYTRTEKLYTRKKTLNLTRLPIPRAARTRPRPRPHSRHS